MGGRTTFDLEKVLNLTPEERAYMAGFFDGEGSVGIMRQSSNGKYCAQISIAQNRPAVLQKFHDVFGGALHFDEGKTTLPNGEPISRNVYRWKIAGDIATRAFLDVIRPYAIVKAPEIDEVMFVIKNKHNLTDEQIIVVKENLKRFRKPQLVSNGTTG